MLYIETMLYIIDIIGMKTNQRYIECIEYKTITDNKKIRQLIVIIFYKLESRYVNIKAAFKTISCKENCLSESVNNK